MKRLFIQAIFYLLLLNTSTAQSIYISLPADITSSSSDGGTRPRIALLNDSIPLVVHSRGGSDPAIFFSKWNGYGFNSPVRLTSPGTLPLSSYVNSPEIAVTGDTVYIVYADHTDSASIILVRSFDGGNSFEDSINVIDYSANHVEFPGIALLPGGKIAITYMLADLGVTNTELMFCTSTDGGSTFSPPQNISAINPGQPCECCPNSLTSQGNTIVLGYRNNNSNIRDFYTLISTDGGQSFNGQRADTSNWFNAGCPSNGIDLMLNGDSLFWAFCNMQDGYMRAQNGSLDVFNPQIPLNTRSDTSSINTAQSQAAIAGNADTLIIFWQDNRLGSSDVYLSWRIQAGDPFSGPIRVNYSPQGTQRSPDAIFMNGVFHVVYQDYSAGKACYNRIAFSEFTSTGSVIKNNSPLLYPNPSSDHIHIIAQNNQNISSVSLFDIQGRLIHCEKSDTSWLEMDIRKYAAGSYLVDVLYTDGSRSVSRFEIR